MANWLKYRLRIIQNTIINIIMQQHNKQELLCGIFNGKSLLSKYNYIMKYQNHAGSGPTRLTCHRPTGPRLNVKTVFPMYGIPMSKIRRSWDRLIFNMGILILARRHLYIETPSGLGQRPHSQRNRSSGQTHWGGKTGPGKTDWGASHVNILNYLYTPHCMHKTLNVSCAHAPSYNYSITCCPLV